MVAQIEVGLAAQVNNWGRKDPDELRAIRDEAIRRNRERQILQSVGPIDGEIKSALRGDERGSLATRAAVWLSAGRARSLGLGLKSIGEPVGVYILELEKLLYTPPHIERFAETAEMTRARAAEYADERFVEVWDWWARQCFRERAAMIEFSRFSPDEFTEVAQLSTVDDEEIVGAITNPHFTIF